MPKGVEHANDRTLDAVNSDLFVMHVLPKGKSVLGENVAEPPGLPVRAAIR
jgi:hypothetical protein